MVLKRFKRRYLLAAIVLIGILIGIAVAVTLSSYTTTLTITGVKQLSQGASTSSWTVYVNEQNQIQYVPGATSEPIFNPDDTSTYAFNVTTDANKACSVEINLALPVSSDFSSFEITVLYWTGSAWSSAQLYTTATGSTPLTFIDGTMSSTSGYIQQAVSTSTYYLVEVTYTYTQANPPNTPYTVDFVFTPLPEAPF